LPPPPRTLGFADVHSHVLYGMDDGAKTREDSLRMLALAAESGTTDIVATPHANSRYRYEPAVIDAQIADLNASVDGIRVHRGCDFHLQMDNIQDAVANPAKYTVNGHAYLMVEFPDILLYRDVDGILNPLIAAGLVPVITHPERNSFLHTRIGDIGRWVSNGCHLQVTAGSVTGTFGKPAQRFARELLHLGFVQIIASDAHDCVHRPPSLTAAYEVMSKEYGEAAVRPLFVDNPHAVIAGDTLNVDIRPLKPRRSWYQFWK
jgi:protein-tyrosine phosphatase